MPQRRSRLNYYLHKYFAELKALKSFPILRLGRYKGGFIFVQRNRRVMPFQLLAARTIGYEMEDAKPVGLEGAYNRYLSRIGGLRLMQKVSGGGLETH